MNSLIGLLFYDTLNYELERFLVFRLMLKEVQE